MQDDSAQYKKVTEYFEEVASNKETCFISNIVLCEIVWVLRSAYKLSKLEIISVLDRLLRTALFDFKDRSVCWSTLKQYEQGRADFSDYLIGQINQQSGCSETVTFDQKLSDSEGFYLL